jgi:hypothetical protein
MKIPTELFSSISKIILFLIVGSVGAFITSAYLGWIYFPPVRRCQAVFCDPYHWQILSHGIAFLTAGLALVIPARFQRIGRLNGICLLTSLIAGIVGSFAAG